MAGATIPLPSPSPGPSGGILHAGLTEPERVRAALMKAVYKHGKGGKLDRDAQEAQEHRTAKIAERKAIVAKQPARDAAEKEAFRTGQPIKYE